MLRFGLLSQMFEYQLYICNRKPLPKLPISPTDMENMPPEKIADIGYISRFSHTRKTLKG
jgi:hypothetical protein